MNFKHVCGLSRKNFSAWLRGIARRKSVTMTKQNNRSSRRSSGHGGRGRGSPAREETNKGKQGPPQLKPKEKVLWLMRMLNTYLNVKVLPLLGLGIEH